LINTVYIYITVDTMGNTTDTQAAAVYIGVR